MRIECEVCGERPVNHNTINCQRIQIKNLCLENTELKIQNKRFTPDTDEHEARFLELNRFSKANYEKLINQWEMYREAHNGFDCYLAYEYLHLKIKVEKLAKPILNLKENE